MASELVIVSGGSSGLGAALLAGCPRAATTYDLSRSGTRHAEHVEVDLATPEGWDAAARFFDATVAGFDGDRVTFIHNAGTLTPMGFAGEVDAAAYRANVLLNSASPQIVGDAFLRAARGTHAACDLVLIGSGAATSPYPGWSSYGAAKAAAAQWVRTTGLEQDHLATNNRVVWIAPGVVDTPMQAEIRSMSEAEFPHVERFRSLHADDQLLSPEEAAEAIWRVLDGGFENGAVLDIRDL